MSDLKSLFDYYGRVARLYPALLCLLPVFLVVAVTNMAVINSLHSWSVLVVAGAAALYFAAAVARSRGKIIEQRLLRQWGGWLTTVMLRHSDDRIDPVTKARYHQALERVCPGLQLPSGTVEAANPAAADDCYRSATKALIEQRRGDQWQMVLRENASYGFRRNMLGLKVIAVAVALIIAASTVLFGWYESGMPHDKATVLAAAQAWPGPLILAFLDAIAALVWLAVVTPSWVRQAAEEYSYALFRSLDAP